MRSASFHILAVSYFSFLLPWDAVAQETIRARLQLEPGGPVQEVTMEVHRVPVDPPTISAAEADLEPGELVIGVVMDGQAVAYPVRYLALSEVLNDRVGDTPIAPSW